MNPDEAWMGKVMAVGIFAAIIWAITALISSKGEGARRMKMVIGGGLALGVAALLFAMAGPVGFIVTLGIGAACVWVFNGFKK